MRRHRTNMKPRRGATAALAAVMMVVMCAFAAFAADLGYMFWVRTELQRTADSAALAGAGLLTDDERLKYLDDNLLPPFQHKIRAEAEEFALLNCSGGQSIELDSNASNKADGEIVIGTLYEPWDPDERLRVNRPRDFNTVQVQKTIEVPLFLAAVLGHSQGNIHATAAATVQYQVTGFRLPPNKKLNMLPIAFKADEWDELLRDGEGDDTYSWNEDTESVSNGSDAIREWNLYPNDTTSGNFGTVDLGAGNNSTNDLNRQILDGISSDDLSAMGGEIALGSDGTLNVNGDTGISAAIKSSLQAIIGEKRIMPLYDTVEGTGNTTYYKVVGFAGIRIMGVRLTGAKKALVVQMGSVNSPYAFVDPNISVPNNLVYTSPRLAR